MKKTFFTLLFACTLLANIFAQNNNSNNDDNYYYRRQKPKDAQSYPNEIFCFYPINAITGNFKIGLEKKLTDVNTLKTNVRFGFGDKSSSYSYGDNSSIFGSSSGSINNFLMAMLEAQYRYYFSDKAPSGVYGGFYGFYKLASFNYSYTSYNYNNNNGYSYYTTNNGSKIVNGGSLGLIIGAQLVTSQKITLDAYMGSGMNFTSPDGNSFKLLGGISDRYFNGIGFIVGVNIGLVVKK